MLAAFLTMSVALPPLDSVPSAPLARPTPVAVASPRDTTPRRIVELSDGYYQRLAVHRWGTYAMLPLFAVQGVLGEQIYHQRREVRDGRRDEIDGGLRSAHAAAAIGVDALFVSNTVTGVWNFVEARHVPEHKNLRTAHSLLMLVSDAGFAASSSMGWNHQTHRNVAYASMGMATLSAVMMWVFK